MATKICDLGHAHYVCDRCGESGLKQDDDGAQPVAPLSRIKLVITTGGQLAEAMLCDPCMYAMRDAFRYALASGRDGDE